MINATFLRKLALVLVSLFFASCDKDYNTIGSDIIGAENFNFKSESFDVKAYNQKVTGVETNNLAINQLGIIDNAIFGKTTANFVTQLTLEKVAPVFNNPATIVIDSVVLDVPYFSTKSLVDGTYQLNSIYTTNATATVFDPIDLKVFQNGYELHDYDPNDQLQTALKFYSNQDSFFDSNKVGSYLNDKVGLINTAHPEMGNENTIFIPNKKEFVNFKIKSEKSSAIPYVMTHTRTTEVESRVAPSMRLHLNKSYFKTSIIEAAADKLVNNNAFKTYFKGLYFQVQNAATGSLMQLDFKKGSVTIYYEEDSIVKNADGSDKGNDRPKKTVKLNMSGNTVNLFNNTDNPTYAAAVATPDRANGDQKLYLKGGEGSLSFIELFPTVAGSTKQTLAQLKAKNVLVNEASLTFTVDKTGMPSDYRKPLRIYVFDADNNTPIYDYYFDNSTSTTNILLNKSLYGGILTTVGTKDIYKINITQHINNILKETTGVTNNVRLGVVVTDNITTTNNSFLKTAIPDASTANPSRKFDRVPSASITNPLGTVLYGTNTGTPDNDIKFEIYYTEPK